MKRKLLLLSFIEGATVMAAELCGAKLLAPIFGSSLYVWASVMGITLAALATGYFFGGWITQKIRSHEKDLFRVIAVAALFILLMPPWSFYLVPRISYLPFLPGVVISTLVVLFPPVFFLGASSPLFIDVQTVGKDAGKVSGTVYAVSTAGGIIATFLCGFYLIPEAGLNWCLIIFGGLLFIVNLIVFRSWKAMNFILLAAFTYVNLQFVLHREGSLLVSESILGKLEVKDLPVNEDTVRVLKVNDIIQTEMSLRSKASISAYIGLIDTLIDKTQSSNNQALVLGLGGGLTSNLLYSKNYKVTAVEFDERIIQAAKSYFYLNPSVETVHLDARCFLNGMKEMYQVVLVDVFKAEEQPSHILTLESLRALKSNLAENGILLINWHGYISGKRGEGTRILVNTLKQAGYHVRLLSDSNDEDHRNIVMVASEHEQKKTGFELHDQITTSSKVNSDNFPLLEKYNAEANKTWRTTYLRYYQNH